MDQANMTSFGSLDDRDIPYNAFLAEQLPEVDSGLDESQLSLSLDLPTKTQEVMERQKTTTSLAVRIVDLMTFRQLFTKWRSRKKVIDGSQSEFRRYMEADTTAKFDPYVIYGFRFNPDWVMKPWSDEHFYWLLVVSAAVLYNMMMIIPRAVFEQLEDDPASSVAWFCFDYLSDFIYLLDIFANVMTVHLDNGIAVMEPRKLIKQYTNSLMFKLDLISIFPTDLFFFYTGRQIPYIILRINRFFRLPRLSEFIYRAETRSYSPTIFRIAVLFCTLFIMIHINGCAYYFISNMEGIGSDSWVYPGSAEWREGNENQTLNINDTMVRKWVYSTYWSTMMLCSIVPSMKKPGDNPQCIFQTVEMLMGVVIGTSTLGRIGALIDQMSVKMEDFKGKRDRVKKYLTSNNVGGTEMERQVIRWFDYIWQTNQTLDEEESVLTHLPDNIKADIARFVHLDVLKNVDIFHELNEQFLLDLCLKLQFQPFNPGGYICRKGDIGREMYVIRRGRLNVVTDDCTKILATLVSGAVFGELSILDIVGNKYGNRRTANVRSVGYSDLFTLSKEDLWASLEEYPDVAENLLEKARLTLIRDNLFNEAEAEAELKKRDFVAIGIGLDETLDTMCEQMRHFEQNYVASFEDLEAEMEALEELTHTLLISDYIE